MIQIKVYNLNYKLSMVTWGSLGTESYKLKWDFKGEKYFVTFDLFI